MVFLLKKLFSILLLAILFFSFFSCESNFKELQKVNYTEFTPNGEADTINVKYTDSGRISAILITPKMLDFATVDFPFTEFPKGVDVTLFDTKGKKTLVRANYAISYKRTSIIDLQGKVKITTQEGQVLETEQLYFDQKNEWFYTERRFTFTSPKGTSTGQGIDFSKDFKVINSQKISGEVQTDK